MGLFASMKLETLEDLFLYELKDLYDAENRLTDALPKLAKAATSPELRKAFQNHLQETQGHVSRLERIFKQLGHEPERETCEAIKGLISEGEEVMGAKGNAVVRDAALIAAAQRVEHYEIAGYGTARALARSLGLEDIPEILTQTLDEEGNSDRTLTAIAEGSINPASARVTA
jgi:ferritin-like metal-binding protein YciE